MSAVLLVHSGGFTSRQWRKLADALAPQHRVVAPDLIGYGSSRWPVGQPFHFRDDLAHLAQLLDEPAHVVGHSYGGFLALQLALAHPAHVRSLAVYEPVAFGILDEDSDADARAQLAQLPTYTPDAHGVDEAWLAAFVTWWNGPGAWDALAEPTRQAFRDVGWKVSQEVASLVTDRTDRAGYAQITVPTLVLGGGRSPLAERRVLDKLARTLPAATLRVFPELGHMAPITHAAIVNAAIVEHVARVEAREPQSRT
ncbi:MAG TPA: alpha/beta hydrolase [Kofleriaceae bacterium]|nr:alpha/beta hydrolase [Kofleriaceae bacterium]